MNALSVKFYIKFKKINILIIFILKRFILDSKNLQGRVIFYRPLANITELREVSLLNVHWDSYVK